MRNNTLQYSLLGLKIRFKNEQVYVSSYHTFVRPVAFWDFVASVVAEFFRYPWETAKKMGNDWQVYWSREWPSLVGEIREEHVLLKDGAQLVGGVIAHFERFPPPSLAGFPHVEHDLCLVAPATLNTVRYQNGAPNGPSYAGGLRQSRHGGKSPAGTELDCRTPSRYERHRTGRAAGSHPPDLATIIALGQMVSKRGGILQRAIGWQMSTKVNLSGVSGAPVVLRHALDAQPRVLMFQSHQDRALQNLAFNTIYGVFIPSDELLREAQIA